MTVTLVASHLTDEEARAEVARLVAQWQADQRVLDVRDNAPVHGRGVIERAL
jgi:hypothetical protein